MAISHLDLTAFRNIGKAVFQPHPELNIIIGNNGSGKTSLLEAIYFLGRGRSFRSSSSKKLIQDNHNQFILHCKTASPLANNIGIQVNLQGLKAKANQQVIKRSSDLATLLPLLFISPDADKLLQIAPKQRRRFLDWGLFHVEHNYLELWKRYNRTLVQRNSFLKSPHDQLKVWDDELIKYGLSIDQYRKKHVENLNLVFKSLIKELLPEKELSIAYKQGWPKNLDLKTAIYSNHDSDRKMGFTQRGPHRCDLQILDNKTKSLAEPFLSGGQLKLTAICLVLAQATIVSKVSNEQGILLIDDIAAELDPDKRRKLLEIVLNMGMQLFITSTDPSLITLPDEQSHQVFHVEHGTITATDVSN